MHSKVIGYLVAISILYVNVVSESTMKKDSLSINNRPIIGILSQELLYALAEQYPEMTLEDSYIAASYVKFIESAGARVVPIWIGQKTSYYENILSKVNGVLFPGGSLWLNGTNGYVDAGDIIYRIAKRYNDNGDYFPIWGTCLGFELWTFIAANRSDHRTHCSSQKQALPLEFSPGFKNSRMFGNAPDNIVNILSKENVTANFHSRCVTTEGVSKANLTNELRVISENHDKKHERFISALEHVKYPFYGVIFHPEKNIFEWIQGKNIPHSPNAIKVTQYFADFFVNEARKNHHKFSTEQEENEALIYNYPTYFTGINGSSYVQVYMFKAGDPTRIWLETGEIVSQGPDTRKSMHEYITNFATIFCRVVVNVNIEI